MRDYSKFFTPPGIAEEMVSHARLEPGDKVLEPHFGMGNIIHAIRRSAAEVTIHGCEINPEYFHFARLTTNLHVEMLIRGDFLKVPLINNYYDRVIANPPFNSDTNLQEHFLKMYFLVKRYGHIVTITPQDFIRPMEIVNCVKLIDCIPIENWATNSDGSKTPIQIAVYTRTL